MVQGHWPMGPMGQGHGSGPGPMGWLMVTELTGSQLKSSGSKVPLLFFEAVWIPYQVEIWEQF